MQHSRRFRVCYTKHFVSGLLQGLTHKTAIHMPDASSAINFRNKLVPSGKINGNQITKPCVGSSAYTVSDVYIIDTATGETVPCAAK